MFVCRRERGSMYHSCNSCSFSCRSRDLNWRKLKGLWSVCTCHFLTCETAKSICTESYSLYLLDTIEKV
jgi:hypothetical protein